VEALVQCSTKQLEVSTSSKCAWDHADEVYMLQAHSLKDKLLQPHSAMLRAPKISILMGASVYIGQSQQYLLWTRPLESI
jgi:hypothetical protein